MEYIKITRDVIAETAKKLDVDYRLIEKQYYYWLEQLSEIKKDPKNVAIQIRNFGTLYLSLKSANAYLHRNIKKGQEHKNKFVKEQIAEIEKRIQDNKDKGIKKQPFYKKRVKTKKPLNF